MENSVMAQPVKRQVRLGTSPFQRLYMGLPGRDSKIENRRTEPVSQQSGTELS